MYVQMRSDRHKRKRKGFIEYLDANSLYPWAMKQKLPVGNFRFISTEAFEQELAEIMSTHIIHCTEHVNISDKCEKCARSVFELDESYLIECDIEYPRELHDAHNDYPLAPENMVIPQQLLSEIQKADKSPRLTGNLCDKKNYTLFLENYLQYQALGLKVTKIHRVVKFKQAAWMRTYMDYNLKMRKETKNDIFKLASNSPFGKTMENVRNFGEVKFERDPDQVQENS